MLHKPYAIALWREIEVFLLVRVPRDESALVDGCRESEISMLSMKSPWGFGGARRLLPNGGAAARRLREVDRRYGLRHGFGLNARIRAASRGDATGTRSGSPCQDVWYYHTHLAVASSCWKMPVGSQRYQVSRTYTLLSTQGGMTYEWSQDH